MSQVLDAISWTTMHHWGRIVEEAVWKLKEAEKSDVLLHTGRSVSTPRASSGGELAPMAAMDPTRAFVKDVKRIIIKVGTAVVSRLDGRMALGRLGSLCEQVKELNSEGLEVILVTSGAIGCGRQRLGYRRFVHSSFADLQKPQIELDGKACAAVGQSGLMALYDALFSQLDVTAS